MKILTRFLALFLLLSAPVSVRAFNHDYSRTWVTKIALAVPDRKGGCEVRVTFEQALEMIRQSDNLSLGVPKIVYLVGWRSILSLFTDSEAIIETARHYIGWGIVIPLAGCIPFLIDGILLGATRTQMLRNTMFIAIACYFALYYGTVATLGNNAVWLAFVSFIVLRGVLLLIVTRNLSPDRLMPDGK